MIEANKITVGQKVWVYYGAAEMGYCTVSFVGEKCYKLGLKPFDFMIDETSEYGQKVFYSEEDMKTFIKLYLDAEIYELQAIEVQKEKELKQIKTSIEQLKELKKYNVLNSNPF